MKVPKIKFRELEALLGEKGPENPDSREMASVNADLPERCFAIDYKDLKGSSVFEGEGVAVFAFGFREARDQLYLFRKKMDCWLLCRLVRTESKGEGANQYRPSRRKSFMTPTPLHIPDSRVSPIPDYTHAVFYLEPLEEKRIEVVQVGQSNCLFPLVHFQKNS